MTHVYAARRLLEHGPLTMREFLEITRWTPGKAHSTMFWLERTGVVIRESYRANFPVYRLAS